MDDVFKHFSEFDPSTGKFVPYLDVVMSDGLHSSDIPIISIPIRPELIQNDKPCDSSVTSRKCEREDEEIDRVALRILAHLCAAFRNIAPFSGDFVSIEDEIVPIGALL